MVTAGTSSIQPESRTQDRPAFLITIDTEGDNLWASPRVITTENATYLPRFQALCERHGLKPTWLVNWEMVQSPAFQEFGRDVLRRGKGEIGMHLHAWNSPPQIPLTEDDDRWHPYLIDYSEPQIREKIKVITEALQDTFALKPLSHRAGRWGLNQVYARILNEFGYLVDCTVTPHVSWRGDIRYPRGSGGSDYTHFPDVAYFLDLDAIHRSGDSSLLEVPVTVFDRHSPLPVRCMRWLVKRMTGGRFIGLGRLFPPVYWLCVDGRTEKDMTTTLIMAIERGRDYAEFAIHSSNLMPGGSPWFPTARSVEVLYEHLENLFALAARHCEGLTLTEYYHRFRHSAVGQGVGSD